MFVHDSNLLCAHLQPPPEFISVERMILHYRQCPDQSRPRKVSSNETAF